MKSYLISLMGIILLVFGQVAGPPVEAAPVTFDLTYAGINGSSATGTGFVTFDDTVLPNPGVLSNATTAAAGVLDFSLTILGASSGNGTFDLTDITRWIWQADPPDPVDLTMELVGQSGFFDFNLGTIGQSPGAPQGVNEFTIRTNVGLGDRLQLTSMSPRPIPIPNTLLLFGTGLAALIGWRARRVKTS